MIEQDPWAAKRTVTLPVAEGLQREKDMLGAVCSGAARAGVCVWRSADQALVVPRSLARGPAFAAACPVLEAAGYPVLARETGGDAVPQAAGVCNVAVCFFIDRHGPEQRSRIDTCYEALCLPLVRWLQQQGLAASLGSVQGAFCDGRFNIVVGTQKVAGTAQRWRQVRGGDGLAVLAHAALMVEADVHALVAVTNHFYRLCNIDRRCQVASHTTVNVALVAAGRQALDLDRGVARLPALYHELLDAGLLPGVPSP